MNIFLITMITFLVLLVISIYFKLVQILDCLMLLVNGQELVIKDVQIIKKINDKNIVQIYFTLERVLIEIQETKNGSE